MWHEWLRRCRDGVLASLALAAGAALAQSVPLQRDAVLRAALGADSPMLRRLATGERVELLQLQGGWARVQVDGRQGWVRASQLALALPETAAVSRLDTGRRAPGATAVTLGVRTSPARVARHALIFGVGTYHQDPARLVPPLAGIKHDITQALAMARHMQVPPEQITVLRDQDVTRASVEQAIRDLQARVQTGDRVFIYWSGHGSRYFDTQEQGCVETLLPYDLQDISNRQFAEWLKPLAGKADKLLVMYDACHSGGVSAAATRAWPGAPVPKFTQGEGACVTPSNVRSRSLDSAVRDLGVDGQDVVHVASSRPDEVSFDFEESGGIATSSMLACMTGAARDIDGSGAVSIDELVACAQPRIEQAMANFKQFEPQHLVVSGNRGFVPAWFAGDPPPQVTAPAPTPGPLPAPPAALAPAEPVVPSPQSLLEHLHAQRDAKRRVVVKAASERLRIGVDSLDFSVTSSHDGHVYVAMLGSDQQSLYLLFPNDLDANNRIRAGETMLLPRAGWHLTAAGPKGRDQLLVMVTDGRRDLSRLGGGRAGPFTKALTDAQGRSRLQWLLNNNPAGGSEGCTGAGCSDAFGAALLNLEEY